MINRAEYDPLDLQLDRVGATRSAVRRGDEPERASVWAGSRQSALLLLLGIAFGPEGLGVLTPAVLTVVDPVLPVALAALGVLAALTYGAAPGQEKRLAGLAALEAVAAAAVVTGGMLALGDVAFAAAAPPWLLALALGASGAASAAVVPSRGTQADTLGGKLADRDVLVAIVLGSALLLAARHSSLLPLLEVAAQATALAVVVAVVGWLLLSRSGTDAEQHVFSAATVLLLGGIAEALSMVALFVGMIAGFAWRWTGGPTRDAIGRDLAHVQHPLVAFILLTAGARVEFSVATLMLAIGYVLLRALAKGAAGRVAARLMPGTPSVVVRRALRAPGIIGVAIAVNAARVLGPEAAPLLSIVVLGTVMAQLVASDEDEERG